MEMKPHRNISNWFITNIRKEGRYVYGELWVKYDNGSKDLLESGTLQSIVKRIEKELK